MSANLTHVRQLGYVVTDVESAMRYWTTRLGVGPFFYEPELKFQACRYKGKPSPVIVSLALAQAGDVQIELIQPLNDVPSPYRDFITAHGEGLQHLGFWIDDGFYDKVADMRARGFEELLTGYTMEPNGPFAYFGPVGPGGMSLELICMTLAKRTRYQRIAAAADQWSGDEPIRAFNSTLS